MFCEKHERAGTPGCAVCFFEFVMAPMTKAEEAAVARSEEAGVVEHLTAGGAEKAAAKAILAGLAKGAA